MKNCSHCKQTKPLNEFNKNKSTDDGLQKQCQPCQRAAASRSQAKAGKTSIFNKSNNLRVYWPDLTREQRLAAFDDLFKSQRGECAICLKAFPSSKATHVDHDHATGIVRGLLCMHCNQAIGKLNDSPETLERAAAYLRGLVK